MDKEHWIRLINMDRKAILLIPNITIHSIDYDWINAVRSFVFEFDISMDNDTVLFLINIGLPNRILLQYNNTGWKLRIETEYDYNTCMSEDYKMDHDLYRAKSQDWDNSRCLCAKTIELLKDPAYDLKLPSNFKDWEDG